MHTKQFKTFENYNCKLVFSAHNGIHCDIKSKLEFPQVDVYVEEKGNTLHQTDRLDNDRVSFEIPKTDDNIKKIVLVFYRGTDLILRKKASISSKQPHNYKSDMMREHHSNGFLDKLTETIKRKIREFTQ